MFVDNENLSGLKALLSWFSNQYSNRKNRLQKRRLKVYETLPPAPQPVLTILPTRWNKNTKRKIKKPRKSS